MLKHKIKCNITNITEIINITKTIENNKKLNDYQIVIYLLITNI